ncbi:sigma-70 family RNA polymerase sigma factor [Huintestinicola sp.]|uniref:sigma-70 family RNA polymerase sigma factor n=1 Tax=Huintestinicola sp. TaxID=2981661 RepID=UPI003D7E482B
MTADRSDNNDNLCGAERCDVLSERSDEELVMLCRENKLCVSCYSELVYRYFPLVKSKAAAICPDPSAYDDFIQEGMLGLLSAVRSFKDDKSSKFSSYAYTCVVNRMKTAAAKLRGQQFAEDNSDSEEPASSLTPESIIIQREIFKELENTLSPMEKRCFLLHLSGLSFEEIGARLGISERSAKNAESRAGAKLRGKLVGNDG